MFIKKYAFIKIKHSKIFKMQQLFEYYTIEINLSIDMVCFMSLSITIPKN